MQKKHYSYKFNENTGIHNFIKIDVTIKTIDVIQYK